MSVSREKCPRRWLVMCDGIFELDGYQGEGSQMRVGTAQCEFLNAAARGELEVQGAKFGEALDHRVQARSIPAVRVPEL